MTPQILFNAICITTLFAVTCAAAEVNEYEKIRNESPPYSNLTQFGNVNISKIGNGKTYWVDPNHLDASDEGPGSKIKPWKTFWHACSQAKAGDTVNVMPGVYVDKTENNSKSMWRAFNPKNSGKKGNPIVFRSVVPRAAILKSSAKDNKQAQRNKALSFWGKHDIVYDGFKTIGMVHINGSDRISFINGEVTIGSIAWGDPSLFWGIALERSDNCLIRNNKIHEMTVVIKNSSKHVRNNQGGIMVFGGGKDMTKNNLIENNYVDVNFNVYAGIANKGGNLKHNLYRNNFIKNAEVGIYSIGSTDGTKNVYDSYYVNNIVLNTTVGIYFRYGTLDTYVVNNSFIRNKHSISFYSLDSIGTIFINNIMYNSKSYIDAKGYFKKSKGKTFSDMFKVLDHNQFSDLKTWVIKDSLSNIQKASLEDIQGAGHERHSFQDKPAFSNPIGTEPEDYKLLKVRNEGFGGKYSKNIGALSNGEINIGITW